MKRIILFLLLAAPLVSRAAGPEERVREAVRLLETAFETRSAEGLLPLLADSCRVERYEGDVARRVLAALVAQLAPSEELRLVAWRPADGGCEADFEMTRNGKSTIGSFALDDAGRFTRLSLVGEQRVQVVRNRVEPLRTVPCCELPFELRNGFVVLTRGVALDGCEGVYLLDTGCRHLLFNSASPLVAAALGREGVVQRSGVVASGVRSARTLSSRDFGVGDDRFAIEAAASDLSALAEAIGLEELTGLVGYELLRRFEVHVDYAARRLRLYALDDEGRAAGAPEPQRRIAFETAKGCLPLFDLRSGGETLRMVFDTGAQGCCLTPEAAQRLGRRFRQRGETTLRDADGAAEVSEGCIRRLEWGGDLRRRVPAVVRASEAWGDADGVVGYPMVAGRCVSLNFVRKELGFY